MATQCRGTKTKRINRHKLAVIQAYIIIGTLVLIGFIGGLVVGRATAPKKQVTVTETVEVPSYEADSLPVAEEVTYFDVPLSHSLQRYIYEVCADENVPVSLIIAMIDQESKRTSLPSIPTVSRGLTALLLPMPPMVIRWISKNSIVWREQSLTFTTGSPMRVREGGHSHGILV